MIEIVSSEFWLQALTPNVPRSRIKVVGSRNEMNTSKRRLPKRLIAAPPPSHPGLRSIVLNVECAADEEVEWLWTETREGRFVSGYQLVPRLELPM